MKHCPLPAGRTPGCGDVPLWVFSPLFFFFFFFFGSCFKILTKRFLLQLHNIVLMQQHSPSVLLPLRYFSYHGNDNIIWMGVSFPRVSSAGHRISCQVLCQGGWSPDVAFTCGNAPHNHMGIRREGRRYFSARSSAISSTMYTRSKPKERSGMRRHGLALDPTSCNHPCHP
ncbi:unnamed protein product, partial [Bubo scandiacus]